MPSRVVTTVPRSQDSGVSCASVVFAPLGKDSLAPSTSVVFPQSTRFSILEAIDIYTAPVWITILASLMNIPYLL